MRNSLLSGNALAAITVAAMLLLAGCVTSTKPLPPPPSATQNNQFPVQSSIVVERVSVDGANQGINALELRPDPDPNSRDYEYEQPASVDVDAVPAPVTVFYPDGQANNNPFINRPEPTRRGRPTVPPLAKVSSQESTYIAPAPPLAPPLTNRAVTRAKPVSAAAPVTTYTPPAPTYTSPEVANRGTSSIVLGEGDVIEFNMFGQEDMQTTAFVSPQGNVSLPLIGDTQVGGLTPGQAEQKITNAYREGGYFKNPQVNITLETFRSQQISVLGEVNLPGRYPLETRTTILDALAVAEGVKPTGARVVTVISKRANGTERSQIDLDDLVSNSGQLDRVVLSAGDIVYVPKAELFYIYGEVRRPDAYAIKPGMTLMQALSLGGGLTDKGSNSRIVIQRKATNGIHTLKPELNEPVQPDDVIYVKERFF